MPPHHGSVDEHLSVPELTAEQQAAIAATDAADQGANTGVGEGPWVPRPEEVVTDEATAVTRPVRRI